MSVFGLYALHICISLGLKDKTVVYRATHPHAITQLLSWYKKKLKKNELKKKELSKNFIENMSWFQRTKPRTILLSLVGFTTLTP